MPPEYAAYQVSPHARVDCVDCHIGRGFIATRITRKAGDLEHVFDTVFTNYEFPIFAKKLRPARETCEKCHYPAKFSDDSLRQNISYLSDEDNTRISTYLALRTGGGSQREGLGLGIHWHVESEVYYIASDELEQTIPYVRVVKPDGTEKVYRALNSGLTDEQLKSMPESQMDCITCHNRITHNILPPEKAVDQALFRNLINPRTPYIRKIAVDVLSASYETDEQALEAIKNLPKKYAQEYPGSYDANKDEVEKAASVLAEIYVDTVFRVQKVDWTTHPNNIGHTQWAGCWRCHDGQHVADDGEAIRLECNLCHSIPQVVGPDVIEPILPLSTGQEPKSHLSTHWIALHNQSMDQTCQACHTTADAGGTSNTSFCSNSACHGTSWSFAQLDAPGLKEILEQERPPTAPTESAPTPEPVGAGGPTWDAQIGPMLAGKCLACHSAGVATAGLVLEDYASAMKGAAEGPVISPGDPDGSKIVQVQIDKHFANLASEELDLLIEWIKNGAPEK
jgi:hypothetical protein